MVIRIFWHGIMLLTTLLDTHYVPERIALARQYEEKLYRVARQFSAHLGRAAATKDFSTQSVYKFLADYQRQWSARSTNNQRQILLTLWQFAAERGLCPPPDRKRIRKLPVEHDPPTAWTEVQVAELFAHCMTLDGFVGEVPAADWWLSLFASIYWTSCRIGSMLAVTADCFDGAGLLVRKQKNHRPQWYPLPESCREIIEHTRPETRKLIWAHPWHQRTVWAKCRKIIEAAGLPAPRTGRQLFHRLRRTTITLCAAVDPAVAQRTAGHADYATTLKHYIDPRMVARRTAADMIRYPELRERGWQIGSGPTESQCKLCTKRLKGYGRRWDWPNATAVAALYALDRNGQWRQFWPNARPTPT